MEYRRFNDTILLRLDSGEEITKQVKAVAEAEQIRLASIEALGAVNDFTVGVYDVQEKQFQSNRFTGAFEIVSLTGTLTTQSGKPYLHLHMSAGNDRGEVFGGHLVSAVISATCEMVIRVIDGTVERAIDPVTGLNVFRFV